ncbi:hypothetical protein MSG28_011452 [Choristoneura fumiferana]|uniref:Uncharacterized protein n=1 Tax=Choristoneura fumiferana TaxID=7141 RepID=A0ACC0JNH6_CHOFU|nr:hypothetical protein MSG28_011452 [Choristoneura fumiferana]
MVENNQHYTIDEAEEYYDNNNTDLAQNAHYSPVYTSNDGIRNRGPYYDKNRIQFVTPFCKRDGLLKSGDFEIYDTDEVDFPVQLEEEPDTERFSKRQARAPEIMNEVSSYRDPLMFRYQFPTVPREAYGRVVTKAPPNVVRTPDYDEMFGMLNVPHTSGKILRFEALKKMIRQEHVRELQRKYETEQKQELKELAAGRG